MTHPDIVEAVARALHEGYKPFGDYSYSWDDPLSSKEMFRALAQAALSAIHDAGLVLVPSEPTPEQISAGSNTPGMQRVASMMIVAQAHGASLPSEYLMIQSSPLAQAYRAMLTAHMNGDGE